MEIRNFVIGKVDLDSCGTGLLLGIRFVRRGKSAPHGIRVKYSPGGKNTPVVLGVRIPRDDVIAVNTATPEQLADKNIICIECGGAGRTAENNWDHHEQGGPTKSAVMQVWEGDVLPPHITDEDELMEYEFFLEHNPIIPKLVEYIDILDTKGPQAFRESGRKTPKIPLSYVFSGMLFMVQDPVEQFRKGVDILARVIEQYIDPFGEMPQLPEWQPFIAAKQKNDRQITEAIKSAQWEITASGKKLGYLETEVIKAPGALYNSGAEIVVAFNPEFGQPPVRKFTVAGNGIRVDAILFKLNALETGWGGSATGTIVGSPREGSKLSLYQVVRIVKETL